MIPTHCGCCAHWKTCHMLIEMHRWFTTGIWELGRNAEYCPHYEASPKYLPRNKEKTT